MDSQESRDFWSFATKVGCLAPVDGFSFGTDASDFIAFPSVTNIQQGVPPEPAAAGTSASLEGKECRYVWLTWLDDNGTELKRLYGAPIRISGNLSELRGNDNQPRLTLSGSSPTYEGFTMRLPLDLYVKPDEPVLSFVPPPAGGSSTTTATASSAVAPQHSCHRQEYRDARGGPLKQRRITSDILIQQRKCIAEKFFLAPASPDTVYLHNGGCLLVHPADLHPQQASGGDVAAAAVEAHGSTREAQMSAAANVRAGGHAEKEKAAVPPSHQGSCNSQQEDQVEEGPRRKLRQTSYGDGAAGGSRNEEQQIQQRDSLGATQGGTCGEAPPLQKLPFPQRKELPPGNNQQSLEEEMIDERQRRRWKGVTRYVWSDRGKFILLSNAAGLWLYAGCKAIETALSTYSDSRGQLHQNCPRGGDLRASGAGAVHTAAGKSAAAAADSARVAGAPGDASTGLVVQYLACSTDSLESEASSAAGGTDAQQQQRQQVARAADVAHKGCMALPAAAVDGNSATGYASLSPCSDACARGGGSPTRIKPFLLLKRPSSREISILSPSFSPDSSRIAFVYAQDLHVMALLPRQRQQAQQHAEFSLPSTPQSSSSSPPAHAAAAGAREGLSPTDSATTDAPAVTAVSTWRGQHTSGAKKPAAFSEAAHAAADGGESGGDDAEEAPLVNAGVCMLTTSGKEGKVVNGLAEYIAQEEMDRLDGYWWSPCGKYIAFCQYEEQHIPPLCLQRLNLPRYCFDQRQDGGQVAAALPGLAGAVAGVAARVGTEKGAATGSGRGGAGHQKAEQQQQPRTAGTAEAATPLNSEGESPASGQTIGDTGETERGAGGCSAAEEWLDDGDLRDATLTFVSSVCGSAAQEGGGADKRQQLQDSRTPAPVSEESDVSWPLIDEYHRFPFAGTANVFIRVGVLHVPSASAISAAATHAPSSPVKESPLFSKTRSSAAAAAPAASTSALAAPSVSSHSPSPNSPYFCIETPLVACSSCRTPCRCAAPGFSGAFSLGCEERFISLPVADWKEDFYVARVSWISVASWEDIVLLKLLTAAEAVELEQRVWLQQEEEKTLQEAQCAGKKEQQQQGGRRTPCVTPPPLVVLQLQDRLQQELRLCVALPVCVDDLMQHNEGEAAAAGKGRPGGDAQAAGSDKKEQEKQQQKKQGKKREEEEGKSERGRGIMQKQLRCVVSFQERSSLFINLHDDFRQIGKSLWYIWTAERDTCKDIFLQNLALPGQSFRVLRTQQPLRVHRVLGCTDTRYSSQQQQYLMFSFFPQKQPTSHHVGLAALPSAQQLRQLQRKSLSPAAAANSGAQEAAAWAVAAGGSDTRVRRWGVKGKWSIAIRELQLPFVFLTNPLVEGQHTMTLCKGFPLAVHQHHSLNCPRQLWVRYFRDWDEVFAACCTRFTAAAAGGKGGGGPAAAAALPAGREEQQHPTFYSLRDAATHAEELFTRAAAAMRKRRQQQQLVKGEGGGERRGAKEEEEVALIDAAAAADSRASEQEFKEERKWKWDRDINGELFDGCEELFYVYGKAAAAGEVLFEFSEVQRIFLLLLRELQLPAFFTCSSRSGETLYGVCYRPDPSLHGNGPHRAVVSLYGGPTLQFVPNAFDLLLDMRAQALARLGLVVVKTDNRGSRGRTVTFEKKSIYLHLGEAELEDQKAAVMFLYSRDIIALHAKEAQYLSPSPSPRRPENSCTSKKPRTKGDADANSSDSSGSGRSTKNSEAAGGLLAAGKKRQLQQLEQQQEAQQRGQQQRRHRGEPPHRGEEGEEGGGAAAVAGASTVCVERTCAVADPSDSSPRSSSSSSCNRNEGRLAAAVAATPAAELRSGANRGESRTEDKARREEILSGSSSSGGRRESDSFLPAGVGICGMSYGGYLAALALFKHEDIFSCSWSAAPVTTWELYSTHFTERYLSTPQRNAVGYRNSSVLAHVKGLDPRSHRLKLVHGYLDENVHMQHSLALLRRMLECQFPAEFICLPQSRHGPSVPAERLFAAQEHIIFFAETLLPPSKRPQRPCGVNQRSVLQQQQDQQGNQQQQQ